MPDPTPTPPPAPAPKANRSTINQDRINSLNNARQIVAAAATARATLEAAVKSIIARRREIQFAADAQWPASNPANAGIRREFRLSPDKAMK